jgi:REP element-mobilizing transposase RayT
MPRSSRLRSSTGYHHIMLRGINRSNIFGSDQDKAFFLNSMYRAREKSSFKVIGYCLMNTHVHLLLQESEEIGVSIKRIYGGTALYPSKSYKSRDGKRSIKIHLV